MKIVALDTGVADFDGSIAWDDFEKSGKFSRYPRTAPEEVVGRSVAAEAVIVNKVQFMRPILEKLPLLRYIGITATGTNNVDLVCAGERGIAVTNVPAYSTESVTQLVFAFLLEMSCRVGDYQREVAAGEWVRSPDFCLAKFSTWELDGKTLGILGYGAIGKRVGEVAAAFGMRVLKAALPGRSCGSDRLPLEPVLAQSDAVTLHCPLTAETRQLINERALALMKPTAVLINTGRGGLVDERALAAALHEKRIAGAAVDVLSSEPPAADNPLLSAPNVVITPHIAWTTQEARKRLISEAAKNLQAFLQGQRRNRVESSNFSQASGL